MNNYKFYKLNYFLKNYIYLIFFFSLFEKLSSSFLSSLLLLLTSKFLLNNLLFKKHLYILITIIKNVNIKITQRTVIPIKEFFFIFLFIVDLIEELFFVLFVFYSYFHSNIKIFLKN